MNRTEDKEASVRVARTFLEQNPEGVEQDPKKLSHMLSTDLRDTLPPQLYALIANVAYELKKNLEES